MMPGTGPIPNAFAGSAARYFWIVISALILTGFALQDPPSDLFILWSILVGLAVITFCFRWVYIHPAVGFLIPWFVTIGFAVVPLSEYSRPLQFSTCVIMLLIFLTWLLVTSAGPLMENRGDNTRPNPLRPGAEMAMFVAFAAFTVLAAINIVASGFIPIVSLITTGRSRFHEFGIPSVYGAFLAYANTLGCALFYVYLKNRRRIFLLLLVPILLTHVAFISRANVITLLVELLVVYSLVEKMPRRTTVAIAGLVAIVLFGLAGELRSGSIRALIGIRDEFDWVPNGAIWLYAYSHFNLLNLENAFLVSGAPYFDGSMWNSLLPTILRPPVEHLSFLEIAAMNVSSFAFPIYLDVGASGLLLCVAVIGALTSLCYMNALKTRSFSWITTYATLYFCCMFSFFWNFWFYLPVVAQLAIVPIFGWALHGSRKAGSESVGLAVGS